MVDEGSCPGVTAVFNLDAGQNKTNPICNIREHSDIATSLCLQPHDVPFISASITIVEGGGVDQLLRISLCRVVCSENVSL